MLKNLDAARLDAEQAVKLDPSTLLSWETRGWVKDLQGETSSALEDYSKAIEFSPGDPRLHGVRANIFMRLSRFAEARADLDIAIAGGKNELLATRAYVNTQISDLESAIADAKKSIELGFEVPYSTKLIEDITRAEKARTRNTSPSLVTALIRELLPLRAPTPVPTVLVQATTNKQQLPSRRISADAALLLVALGLALLFAQFRYSPRLRKCSFSKSHRYMTQRASTFQDNRTFGVARWITSYAIYVKFNPNL